MSQPNNVTHHQGDIRRRGQLPPMVRELLDLSSCAARPLDGNRVGRWHVWLVGYGGQSMYTQTTEPYPNYDDFKKAVTFILDWHNRQLRAAPPDS